jgi:acyl-CoA synthetase (AMP-forming)/AMP-acid ligase II
MRLIDYLDKGATLGAAAPCLTMGEKDMSYGDVQRLTWRVARALARSGVKPGDKVAILSSNDPIAFACVFSAILLDARASQCFCVIPAAHVVATSGVMGAGRECHDQAAASRKYRVVRRRLAGRGQNDPKAVISARTPRLR